MPFAALNTSHNKQAPKSDESSKCATKEAIEAEAIASFQKCLKLQKDGLYAEAEEICLQLLRGPFLASENGRKIKHGVIRTSVNLKYCVLKNLGISYEKSSHLSKALDYYLMAANIDDSDVSLWSKIGKLAESSSNIFLTKYSYKMTKDQNGGFMPSMIKDMCLLYVTRCYEECLDIISNELKKDRNFFGGLVVLKLILKYSPSLREEVRSILRDCKINLAFMEIPEDETVKIMKNINELEARLKNLDQPTSQDLIARDLSISSPSWLDLGRYLLKVCTSNSDKEHCNILTQDVDLGNSLKLSSNLETQESLLNDNQQEMEISNDPEKELPDVNINCDEMQTENATPAMSSEEQQQTDTRESSKDDIFVAADNLAERRKGKKRKLSIVSLFDEPEFKRRSSRVRNPLKSRTITDISESLSTIKNLLPNIFHVESSDGDDAVEIFETKTEFADFSAHVSKHETNFKDFLNHKERDEVLKFVNHHGGRHSIVEILRSYLSELQQTFHLQWTEELKDTFVKCFEILKKSTEIDFRHSVILNHRQDLNKICLVYLELKLDDILTTNIKGNKSNLQATELKNNPNTSQFTMLKKHVKNKDTKEFDLHTEVKFLENTITENLTEELTIRAFWVLARIYKSLNMLDDSLFYFNETLEHLKSSDIELIQLPNVKHGGLISQVHVDEVMNHVEKSCSIDGLHTIFEKGEHRMVIELLNDASLLQNDDLEVEEKKNQMLMLLDSYEALGEYENCFNWTERVFNNAVKLICKSKDKSATPIGVIKKCFGHLATCTRQLGEKAIQHKKFIRLTYNLASVLEMVFEDSEFKHAQDLESHMVFAWILLYRMIKWHKNDEKISEDDIPHHLKIIISGHDHLGRKGWCSSNNGEYLLFLVEELQSEMDIPGNDCFQGDMMTALEQACHCLYGHPSKKSRGRYLDDHNSRPIPLDWKGGQFLYKLFRPECLPEYDSYKTSAISSESANLLLKLKKLAPNVDNFDELLKNIELYLDGTNDQVPDQPTHVDPLIEELHYLLADFYFKNGETKKAMKYYIRDLSSCPKRFDSWAALALIHSSFLTDILSEHDVKPDIDISLHLKRGLRSFERALGIDGTSSKLWIEYGSFAYILHSHFSYLTKNGINKESDRDEMLKLSGHCFERALVNDTGSGEEWLEHYMLGKVAEKSSERPEVFLQYYLKASEHLHLEKAKYPRRSFSYYNPPHLAVESLEMFYKMHASTLKYLLKHETQLDAISFDIFEKYLRLSAESPLVQGTELQEKTRVDLLDEVEKIKSSEAFKENDGENYMDENHSNQESDSSCDKTMMTERKQDHEPEPMVVDSESKRHKGEPTEATIIRQTSVENQMSENHSQTIQNISSSNLGASEDNKQELVLCGVEIDHNHHSPCKANHNRVVSNEERFSNLLSICIRAFSFILSRYPWHFKSTYKLAYIFFHCRKLRNLESCRALMVGQNFIPIGSSFKCNGMFSERKPANFFNGLWRLPSTELDRCGSFSSHLSRSVLLLCDLCTNLQDPRMLFFLHQQLARCPENATKKYLRDYVREKLSKQAFEDCCAVLRKQLEILQKASESKSPTAISAHDLLMRVFNIRQQCFKMTIKHLDVMMLQIYSIIFPQKIDQCPSLDEVKKFCIAQQNPRMYNAPLIQTAHHAVSNASDARQLGNNHNWNQRNQQVNPVVANPSHKPEVSEKTPTINPSESGKLNISTRSDDIEIIEEVETLIVMTTSNIQTPMKSAVSHELNANTNQTTIKNTPVQIQRQTSSGVLTTSATKNANLNKNRFQPHALKEQINARLPVQLKLAPEVFQETSYNRPPAPRQQSQPFNSRANQRPPFNHPTIEDEVIVLSEDSD